MKGCELMKFPENRPLDILAAGRAGIDLNADALNRPFADVPSFTKTVGGSPANIAQGTAKLGLKTGFIGKVSGDGMGDYVLRTFREAGMDITGVLKDRTGARNCLAITEILSPSNSGSYLYREMTADLLLEPADISKDYIRHGESGDDVGNGILPKPVARGDVHPDSVRTGKWHTSHAGSGLPALRLEES
jgi:5-dehydro-2-deoxygluconokinase